jgi:[ribosomal protein S18]-alanine N-acetyltransferase
MPKYSGKAVEVDQSPSARGKPEVRACLQGDLAPVLGILREAPEAANRPAQALQDEFEHHGRYFLVATETRTSELTGFISGRRVADEAEILNLAVKREFRRQGLAKALVHQLLAIFRDEGTRKVYLEVRESNLAAVALYRSLGFSRSGKRIGYYVEPPEAALILEAKLLPEDSGTFL